MELINFLSKLAFAGIGTAAFALLFAVRPVHYPICAAVGALGWMVNTLLSDAGLSPAAARFLASALVALGSRVIAVKRRCPATILLIPGLFPLIPGGAVYWTVHALVASDMPKAVENGFGALKAAIALVFGVVLVFEIPQAVFSRRSGHP